MYFIISSFIIVSLMLIVAMSYYMVLEGKLRVYAAKNEELQRKVDAWVAWAEEKPKESETPPPESV